MKQETTCDIRVGHAIDLLREIPDDTIDLVVTSPPYWGLRDYKTDPVVFGGDTECEHEWHDNMSWQRRSNDDGKSEKQASNKGANDRDEPIEFTTCRVCDAWKGQRGLEQTPEHFIEHLVEIFDECKRILKPTGNMWVNLGDSYMRKGSYTAPENYGMQKHRDEANKFRPTTLPPGYKEKDLVGIPWAFAFAARKAGWYLRNDIVWAKSISGPHYRGGVCMPEPVQDRCTRSHEFFFHFAKKARYYYDVKAVVEPLADNDEGEGLTRNMRTVWHFNPQPFPGAHFAVYPKHLIEPIVKASTSEYGCCGDCGAPWEREVVRLNESSYAEVMGSGQTDVQTMKDESTAMGLQPDNVGNTRPAGKRGMTYNTRIDETVGWQPTCECNGKIVKEEVTVPPRGSDEVDWREQAEARDGVVERGAGGNTGLIEWSKNVKETQTMWGADSSGSYTNKESKYKGREEHGGGEVKARIIEGITKPKKKMVKRYVSDLPLDEHPVVPAVVLDPFSGSGTSGIVALDEGRSYIGLELSAEYAAMSLRRLKQERTGLTTKRFREAAPELKEYW